MKRFFLLMTIFGGATVLSVNAQSTNQSQTLAPVTITGTPTSDIPQVQSIAANAVPGTEVERAEINNTRDLSARAPNFTVFDANNDRSPRFSLRGFRENGFAAGSPVVAMYIDDVPYADLYSRGVPLFDVERIDFLRGSQDTLYGASGIAGLMSISTTQADNQWHGHAGISYGNYDYQDYRAGIFGPIITDKLFVGISGIYALRDGFVYNNTKNDHPDYRDTLAGKLTLRWTPSDPWEFALVTHAERFNDGFVPTFKPGPGGDNGPFSVNRDLDGFVDTDAVNEALKIAYKTPDVNVSSVTAHRDWRQSLTQDFDFSAFPAVVGFSNPKLEQWSEELRVQSPADAEKLHWLAGLFWLNGDLHTDSGSTTLVPEPGPFGPIPPPTTLRTFARSENNTYAVFGQATYNVWKQLDLTAGIRASYDDIQMHRAGVFQNPNFPPSPSAVDTVNNHFSAIQPKLAATWHFTPDFETYASATLGHQPGGFNISESNPALQQYGASRAWEFELGAKSSWYENRVHADAALFYTETHGYQVFGFSPMNPIDAFVLNAPRVTQYGAELDLSAQPYKPLELTLNLGYTHANFDYFNMPDPSGPGGGIINLRGRHPSFVPEFTANFSAKYHLPAHFYFQGSIQAVGSYYLDEKNNFRQQAFPLVNAQFGYDVKNVDVYVFAKNIFNQQYVNNALDLRTSPGFGVIQQPGDPLTFGVALNAKF